MKGKKDLRVPSPQGRDNYGKINKSCGCTLGTKCNHNNEQILRNLNSTTLRHGKKYILNDGQEAEYDAFFDSFIIEDDTWWGTSVKYTPDNKKIVHRIDTHFIGYPHEDKRD